MTRGDASLRRLATGTRATIGAHSENVLNKRVNNNAFIYCMIQIYLYGVCNSYWTKKLIGSTINLYDRIFKDFSKPKNNYKVGI